MAQERVAQMAGQWRATGTRTFAPRGLQVGRLNLFHDTPGEAKYLHKATGGSRISLPSLSCGRHRRVSLRVTVS